MNSPERSFDVTPPQIVFDIVGVNNPPLPHNALPPSILDAPSRLLHQ